MRVLWFAGNPALYSASSSLYNGGGWIGALQREILSSPNEKIELAIAFPWNQDIKEEKNQITYYGIKKIEKAFIFYKKKEQKQIELIQGIVQDFQPDVIHVFGSESVYGLVASLTTIPTVIHIQGILSAYFETWLPHNLSWAKLFFRTPRMILGYEGQKKFIKREKYIFKTCKYFMGRTVWDKGLTSILSPDAKYFYCSEMLRPEIYYSPKTWQPTHNKQIKLISIISGPVYKGSDVILRTAKHLKEFSNLDFSWNVYGVKDVHFAERLTGINANDVNVFPSGIINAQQLVDHICESDIFIHPSYIENSPNTVCEAQVLGIPIIVTHVGGTETLVENNRTGILVPANDTFMMASQILRLSNDSELCMRLGQRGREVALSRHNPQTIITDLMKTYKTIINE